MKKPRTEMLTVSYAYGGHVHLNHSWDSENVICPQTKLFYVLDGEFVIETDTDTYLCQKGDMVLIPAGRKHSYYLTELGYAEKYWMHFTLHADHVDFFSEYSVPVKIPITQKIKVVNLFRDILSKAERFRVKESLCIGADIMQLIAFYIENSSIDSNARKKKDEIETVIQYIKSHYREPVDLRQLSTLSNLSPNYLIRKFKGRTGYSPIQYANHVKIEMARFSIVNTDRPIGEIMEEVGFLDPAHFSKIFKQHSGYSPRKYREIFGSRPFSIVKLRDDTGER